MNFSQCVCLGIKRSTKLQISKSTPNWDISFLKNPFSRTTTNGSFGLQLFSCICDITNCKSHLGGMLGWALHVSKSKPSVGVFYNHCISDGNQLFSESFGCRFHFILHIMSDKAAFVSWALICIQCYRGNLDLSRSNSASRRQITHLHTYVATNSVNLWDYGINKLNCKCRSDCLFAVIVKDLS